MKYVKPLIVSVFLVPFLVLSQKAVYQSKAFRQLSETHKIIAILPFNVILEFEHPYSKDELENLSKQEGYHAQALLEQHIKDLDRQKLTVNVQSIKQTNALLEAQHIDYSDLGLYTAAKIAEILGVDAVISGRIITCRLFSKAKLVSYDLNSVLNRKSDYGRLAVKISDGKTNKLIWRYEKKLDRKNSKNTEEKLSFILKEVVRKLPYRKLESHTDAP